MSLENSMPMDGGAAADPGELPPGTAAAPGRVCLGRLDRQPSMRYYVWRHPAAVDGGRWLFAVHGISRDAREQMRMLKSAAGRHGYSLVAPLFDELRYDGYQQLGIGAAGFRADEALVALGDELQRLYGPPSRRDLFGFSGGAQFAHRFAMTRPEWIRRLAIAAAGWYTLPDSPRAYPYGVRAGKREAPPAFRLRAFAAIPQLVLVGAEDRTRDRALRKRRHLDQDQGRDRLMRAQAWTESVQRLACGFGLEPRIRLETLEGVGHDFSQAVIHGRLDQRLFQFLDQPGTTR